MDFVERARNQYYNDQIVNRSAAIKAQKELDTEKAMYILEGHPTDKPYIPKEDMPLEEEAPEIELGRRQYNNIDPHLNPNDETLSKQINYSNTVDHLQNMTDLRSRFVKKKPGPKPVYKKYGRFLYQKKKFDDGMLSVKFQDSYEKPYDFRNVHYMGPELKTVMTDLVEGRGLVDVSHLPLKDQAFVTRFQKRSGLPENRIVGNGLQKELSKTAKRLEKVLGSMKAGNDSKKLRTELNQLLNKMMKGGVISSEQVAKISEAFLE